MKHGDVVLAEDIAYAVTRGPLRYADGATQTFDPAGGTVVCRVWAVHSRRMVPRRDGAFLLLLASELPGLL